MCTKHISVSWKSLQKTLISICYKVLQKENFWRKVNPPKISELDLVWTKRLMEVGNVLGEGLRLSLPLEMSRTRLVYWSPRTSAHKPVINMLLVQDPVPSSLLTVHTR
jgi:hypothetical protein